MTTNSLSRRAAISLTLAAACWGIATVVSKHTLVHLPPLTLLVTQLAVSVGFLWALIAFERKTVTWRRPLIKLGLLGWLNPGLSYTLGLIGLQLTTASLSTLLWASEPVLILGLAAMILRERLTLRRLAFAGLALLGVVLLVGFGTGLNGQAGWMGSSLILGGVLFCALYTVFVRQMASEVDPLVTVGVQQAFALLLALALWPLELSKVAFESLLTVHPNAWGWAAVSGVLYYGLAFWFYLAGLKQVQASIAGAFLNLIPVFGLATAYLVLGERLGEVQWVGAGLVLFGIFGLLTPSSYLKSRASAALDWK